MELCGLGGRWVPTFAESCMLNEFCFVLQESIATCIFKTFLSGIFLGLFPKCYEKKSDLLSESDCLAKNNEYVTANVETQYVRGDVENFGAD